VTVTVLLKNLCIDWSIDF